MYLVTLHASGYGLKLTNPYDSTLPSWIVNVYDTSIINIMHGGKT